MTLHEITVALKLWEARFVTCDVVMEGPRYRVRSCHEAVTFIRRLLDRVETENPNL